MNLLYNLAIRLYSLGAKIVSCRNDKARKMLDGQNTAIEYLRSKLDPNEKYIWIHASSLGEFEQGRPLIEMLKKERPEKKIVLSFFSPSGYEVRHDFPLVDAVCYMPFDTKSNVNKFLDALHPEMAFFIKYEFWGNYLQELHRRGIPTYIISAIFRPSQAFFKPWGSMFRSMLRCFDHIFVQDKPSMALLAGIGLYNVTVAGDTRFDRVTDILAGCKEIPEVAAMTSPGTTTIVAGSTWVPDEELILPYFNANKSLRLVIAPHEVNEQRIQQIESMLTRPSVRLSTTTIDEARKSECIIIDCFGKLASAYRYGNIAYVGGGFGVGIHNINEAAVYGIPVLFGPKHHKFKEAKDLVDLGGAYTFDNKASFINIIEKLVNTSDLLTHSGSIAGTYINKNIGATRLIFNKIF
ncbi:MAG: 3-deoxy-D-manno-octulosonic acid transferase [Muribaculaceae bacterium]|nr:3-deoxy-D-manno-octulosonic acid transferase [Muribaculaceae bacterium]